MLKKERGTKEKLRTVECEAAFGTMRLLQ